MPTSGCWWPICSPRPGVESLGSGLVAIRLTGDNATATLSVTFSNLRAPANAAQAASHRAGPPWFPSRPPNTAASRGRSRQPNISPPTRRCSPRCWRGISPFVVFAGTNCTGEIGGAFHEVSGSTEFRNRRHPGGRRSNRRVARPRDLPLPNPSHLRPHHGRNRGHARPRGQPQRRPASRPSAIDEQFRPTLALARGAHPRGNL